MMPLRLCLVFFYCIISSTTAWRVCDVHSAPFFAQGDGETSDTVPIRKALSACDEIILKEGKTFVTGPINITSNQILTVDGTLLASQNPTDYPLVAPLLGYGWGNDENCFPPDADQHKIIIGSLRYSPVIGAFRAENVTIRGRGVIDGRGETWWNNCSKCHYPPHNDSHFCEIASRPKLVEFQFSKGIRVGGESPGVPNPNPNPNLNPDANPNPNVISSGAPLTLQNSPFWTLTPAYSEEIHIHDLR